ncbi:MAG: sugar phosphate isomerase/epimerase [Halieaceae bacterium]
MALERNKLVCYATLPDGHGFENTIAAAAAAGFEEVSLWLLSLDQGREELGSLDAVAACLAAHGMRASVLELLLAWPGGEVGAAAGELAVMQAAAEVMQPEVILAACMDTSLAPGAVARLKSQCQALAPLKVALEFLPWSALPSLESAWQMVEQVDEPNLGFVLDTWHFAWAGQDFDTLARIPGDRIHFIQVNDMRAEPLEDIVEETLCHRLRPGEGVVDWSRLLRLLAAAGVDCPLGTEQFSDEVKAMSLPEASRYLYESVQALFGNHP